MASLQEQLRHKIDSKTKPLGTLGDLEKLAFQIGMVQNTITPELKNPHHIVFAADHGIAQEGVSAYPAEVTRQMALNFLNGGAAINIFAKQHQIKCLFVDAGVNADFKNVQSLIPQKINKKTRNFLKEKAMTPKELNRCFEYSEGLISSIAKTACNTIGFGEMGIGNTSSASLIIHYLTDIPLEKLIGRGTGLNDDGLKNKLEILQKAKNKHGKITAPKEVLQTVGGFEIAQMTAAMLNAFKHKMLILVDGFIAGAAFLTAFKIQPAIIKAAVFCHQSNENGHRHLLHYLNARPLLNLNLRLGEGTGCALAFPLLQSAVDFLNDMAEFETAGVSTKD